MADRVKSCVTAAAVLVVLASTGCSAASTDDPAASVVRSTTNVAGAGVIGIERNTVDLCATPGPADDIGRQGTDRMVLGSGGATTVPADPLRIVVLTMSALDTTCATGTWDRVVGAPTEQAVVDNSPGALRPTYLGSGIATIAGVGPVGAPDIGQIQALSPDLIIGSDDLGDQNMDQLSAIAPSVFTRAESSWVDRTLLAASALGHSADATRAFASFRTRAADTGSALRASQTQASVVQFDSDGGEILGSDSFAGQVLAAAGVRRPGPQDEKTVDFDTAEPTAAEGDLIYVVFAPGGLDFGSSVLESDAWRTLGASTDGRVFTVDHAVWSGDGIVAAGAMLTDLENSLNGYVQ